MYGASAGPWDLAGRWYEQRKYAVTLASLPRRGRHCHDRCPGGRDARGTFGPQRRGGPSGGRGMRSPAPRFQRRAGVDRYHGCRLPRAVPMAGAPAAVCAPGWHCVVGTVRMRRSAALATRMVARHHAHYFAGRPAPPRPWGHPHVHGANLGVGSEPYRAAGGFPALAHGEDRALVATLEQRHYHRDATPQRGPSLLRLVGTPGPHGDMARSERHELSLVPHVFTCRVVTGLIGRGR